MGLSNLLNTTGVVKSLSLMDSLRSDIKLLVSESLLQLQAANHAPLGLVARVITDTFDSMNPRIVTSILISDFELYKDLHLLLDLIKLGNTTNQQLF